MSLTSRTNRWASRVIIVLQLVTWNAVGIILLHRGVNTLRRRILETSDVVEVDPSSDLESVLSSTRHEYDLSTQQQTIDKNVEIIIQIDPDRASPRGDRNLSGLSAIRSERLKNAFEIVSEEQRSTLFLADHLLVPTTVRGTPSSRLNNHLIDRRTGDRFDDKDVTNKISRIVRNRDILGILRSPKGDVPSISSRSDSKIMGSVSTEEKDLDLVENATRTTIHDEMSSTVNEKADRDQLAVWTGKSDDVKVSRANENGATTAIALVSIGAIMLLVGPVVIILRILEERRRARKLIALPARAREDLPPTYEQAVLMDEAPRYSTLALNYDRTPPASPTLSSTYDFEHSCRDV